MTRIPMRSRLRDLTVPCASSEWSIAELSVTGYEDKETGSRVLFSHRVAVRVQHYSLTFGTPNVMLGAAVFFIERQGRTGIGESYMTISLMA